MSNKGDKGMRGMIAFCPVCGSSCEKITWDPKTDTCTCACGWSNDLDRKKQIEEMSCDICVSRKANYADGCRVCSHHENRCLYQDIACSLYNAGYRKQEWISVEERLPEDGVRVLTGCDDGIIRVGISKGGFPSVLNRQRFSDVTHWMPLPEAPKMKGGEEE